MDSIDNYNRFITISKIDAKLENGVWVVKQSVTSSRYPIDGSDHETTEVLFSATDTSLGKAMGYVAATIGQYLHSVGGDLFQKQEKLDEENKDNQD